LGDKKEKLNIVRKVAALCVACMEQHGVQYRNKERFWDQ